MNHVIEKDAGKVQFDQVEQKVQPDSNDEVQSVGYDHMREACPLRGSQAGKHIHASM